MAAVSFGCIACAIVLTVQAGAALYPDSIQKEVIKLIAAMVALGCCWFVCHMGPGVFAILVTIFDIHNEIAKHGMKIVRSWLIH